MTPKDEIMAGFPTSHLTQIAGSINVWIVDWPAISKHPSMDGQIVRGYREILKALNHTSRTSNGRQTKEMMEKMCSKFLRDDKTILRVIQTEMIRFLFARDSDSPKGMKKKRRKTSKKVQNLTTHEFSRDFSPRDPASLAFLVSFHL